VLIKYVTKESLYESVQDEGDPNRPTESDDLQITEIARKNGPHQNQQNLFLS